MKPRRCMIKGAVLLSVTLFAGCTAAFQQSERPGLRPDGHYDNHTYLVDPSRMNLARIMASFATLQTKTVFEMPDGGMVEHQKVGSGVILGGRYVLTVEHVIAHDGVSVVTPFGVLQIPVKKKISEETFFSWNGKRHRLRPVFRNREEDIALLEIPSDVRPPSFPYQLGDSDDLRVGNFVYVVGNPLSIGVNVREGIVSAIETPPEASSAGAIPKHAFMVSNGLLPGDSGSPIIAVRDGRFELVGISQGTVMPNARLSWGIRINVIRDLLLSAKVLPPERWTAPPRTVLVAGEDPASAE